VGQHPPGPTVRAVLFADIVGSTARDRRLGPQLADELRQSFFAAAADAVGSRGGRVVKTLGDGVLCLFASTSSAVDAAVALQQGAAGLGRRSADPLELRVGISVGEVTEDGGGDCFGLAVVEAARLCAGADVGEIAVSELTQRLAASSPHPFRALGRRLLKGMETPVDVFLVEWRPAVEGRGYTLSHIDADPELRSKAAGMLDLIGRDSHINRVRAHMLAWLDPAPGETVLDVGSGTGEDVLALRHFVGETGRVVGLDRSETLVREATRRATDEGVAGVQFVHGDVLSLQFPDSYFDAVRCDRVFQYLLEPLGALREMRRVSRPGGRIVIAETDWETAVFDAPDDELTGRINAAWLESRPNGRAGHQLYRLCKTAGLSEVKVEGFVQIKTDLDDLYRQGVLPALARAAVDAGTVTSAEAARWVASIEHSAGEGSFLRAFTTFVVCGRVP
jgi:ubiquinone/menaquinone biosynthesis C-methylase UbiE/class 3 adenylate cyclase